MVAPAVPFDVDHDFIAYLNGQCLPWAGLDAARLQAALQAQGTAWFEHVTQHCPHLFAAAPVFISARQAQHMQDIILAAETALGAADDGGPRGVFYGYDFHLDDEGAHLIEINTNAGGGFLNALLLSSEADAELYGEAAAVPDLEQAFADMFLEEWRRVWGDAPPGGIALLDSAPESQYLYPEFLLAQACLQRAGFTVFILDPAQLVADEGGLSYGGQRIGLVYNRLTDFTLQHHPALLAAWQRGQVGVTPSPAHHARYADKQHLVFLSDVAALQAAGLPEQTVAVLQRGVPATRKVEAGEAEAWWAERKQWFFKPVDGYGSKGAYRGDKMTRRVFESVLAGHYVAQQLVPPGERVVCLEAAEDAGVALKFDVRCYAYAGRVQCMAARLYQGQTTNFRTPGGGFAPVRVVG